MTRLKTYCVPYYNNNLHIHIPTLKYTIYTHVGNNPSLYVHTELLFNLKHFLNVFNY